jgi:hypothetical protein
MSQPNCSCAAFAHLEGASVPAYINAFLERLGRADSQPPQRYRCRVCGRIWERRAPAAGSAGARPALVRLDENSST